MRYYQPFHHTSQIWKIFHHQQAQETSSDKISAHQTVYNLKMLDNCSKCTFFFLFLLSTNKNAHSRQPLGIHLSLKCKTFYSSVSADVPRVLKPDVTTALKVLNWDADDELNFREMLFSSIWQLMTHLVLFLASLSHRTCCDLSIISIPWGAGGDQLDGRDSEELGRRNRRSWLRSKGRQRVRKMGMKRRKCQWR